jgi:hypothetical protein
MKKISIAVLIVAALGVWVASRWHTWFVEDPEEAYVPSQIPAHVLLSFGDAQPFSRNVSWQADTVLHPSWLELVSLADSDTIRVEAQGEVFRSRGGRAAFYLLTRTYYHKYRLYTIRMIINKWAPPNENLTATYIQNVCRLTGIAPDEPIGIPSDQPAPLDDARRGDGDSGMWYGLVRFLCYAAWVGGSKNIFMNYL